MKELIGTWKSVGTITKAGQFINQKTPATFTFNENGEGLMRFLIVMSAPFTWEADGTSITIHNTQNSSDQQFELVGDKLYTYNTNGTKAVFKKSR